MLYIFPILILDFYPLNLHRKPAQAVYFAEPTDVDLSQCGLLRFFASLGVWVCAVVVMEQGGKLLNSDL